MKTQQGAEHLDITPLWGFGGDSPLPPKDTIHEVPLLLYCIQLPRTHQVSVVAVAVQSSSARSSYRKGTAIKT